MKEWYEKRCESELFSNQLKFEKPVILIFCASLGEYETVKYLVSKLRKQYCIHISFFSPSGYNNLINNTEAYDVISYSPLEKESEIKDFLLMSKAHKAILVSSFLWPQLYKSLNDSNIDYYLIDAKIKPVGLLREVLHRIMLLELKSAKHIYTSDEESIDYMSKIGLTNFSYCEPLRITSILSDKTNKKLPETILKLYENTEVFIFGSTHKEDINLITPDIIDSLKNCKIIIVPHEINQETIKYINSKFKNSELLSTFDNKIDPEIMIIDQIGILKHLYSIARACYVGGGFSSGIHNIMEPAIYNIPIIIGPNYNKFPEAQKLINANNTIVVRDSIELKKAIVRSMTRVSDPSKFDDIFNIQQVYSDIELIIKNIEAPTPIS